MDRWITIVAVALIERIAVTIHVTIYRYGRTRACAARGRRTGAGAGSAARTDATRGRAGAAARTRRRAARSSGHEHGAHDRPWADDVERAFDDATALVKLNVDVVERGCQVAGTA